MTYIAATTQVLRKVLDLLQSPLRPCHLQALHQVGDGGGDIVGDSDVHYFGDYFHVLLTLDSALGQHKTEKSFQQHVAGERSSSSRTTVYENCWVEPASG